MQASVLLLCWESYRSARNLLVLIIFLPCYVALCASKAHHRLGSESVSWYLERSLFLRLPSQDGTPFLGQSCLPTSIVSFFVFYIFSYLFLKTMICFSGCLMSSASIQKLFCGIYSALKCSFDEFVRKVVSLSYSSAIFITASVIFICPIIDVNVRMPEVFEYAYDWLINISIFTTRLNAKTALKLFKLNQQ